MAHAMRGGRVCGSGGCWPTGLCVCFNRNLQNQLNELRLSCGSILGAFWTDLKEDAAAEAGSSSRQQQTPRSSSRGITAG